MKKVCAFFGHRDTPQAIYPKLLDTIEDLIKHGHVTDFMVGYQGNFDKMAYKALCALRKAYPHIAVNVVLAYMPEKPPEYPSYDPRDTCIPDGIERVPRRFAILHRNEWMVKKSDVVVTYVLHGFGGAAKAEASARRKGKEIIALASC